MTTTTIRLRRITIGYKLDGETHKATFEIETPNSVEAYNEAVAQLKRDLWLSTLRTSSRFQRYAVQVKRIEAIANLSCWNESVEIVQ